MSRQWHEGMVGAGAPKLESTVRYLGIEVDDALELSEQLPERLHFAQKPMSPPGAWRLLASEAADDHAAQTN